MDTTAHHPSYRALREALIEGEGWTQEEWEAFEQKHAEHFDGFQATKLDWEQWYDLACEEGE
ncbi:hypothetical protein SEA_JEMERALD_51 [Microbacterium phage Jemerald]|nr:hypothetical protein SEA_JUICER_51 [Microbacterium phage Juicer]WNO27290.1 hypothetical protein SEA_JEMERALD_51 [Microbacterium phage Jemerald]